MITALLLVALSALAGYLYRVGGAGKEEIKWANTKFRDLGVPTVWVAAMLLFYSPHWSWVLCFGLLFGALTTYWKKKGTDSRWYNWVLTGLGYSAAVLPFVIVTGEWTGFLVRALALSAATVAISLATKNVWVEEIGRGAFIILTLPLLTIGG